MRVLSIFGTRPEAIKMAPVVQALGAAKGIESLVCVTAQHRQMLDQVLDTFAIDADFDLDLMRPRQSLAELSAAIFTGLGPLMKDLRPDWVLVQGDTTTVMVTSLLACYSRVSVGHVEAGLRTGDKWQPFPEEINRRVAGVVADLHFAPTEWARQNLLREGVPEEQVLVTGNTVIDALLQVAGRPTPPEVSELLRGLGLPAEEVPMETPRLLLVTSHRRENLGRPLEEICAALREVAEAYGPAVHFLYPVHMNPSVQEPVHRLLGGVANITLLPPLEYLPWVHLLKRAFMVITDSGGLQEEAPGLGLPVLVLREVTERPEGVEAGTVRVVGTGKERLAGEIRRLLDDQGDYESMARAVNPYGDGHAAGRIVEALLRRQGNP